MGDAAGVHRSPAEHSEQGRLAATISSDNADAIGFIEPEGNVVKNSLVREGHLHVLEIDVVAGHCPKHAM
jgi:hypothetical protein